MIRDTTLVSCAKTISINPLKGIKQMSTIKELHAVSQLSDSQKELFNKVLPAIEYDAESKDFAKAKDFLETCYGDEEAKQIKEAQAKTLELNNIVQMAAVARMAETMGNDKDIDQMSYKGNIGHFTSGVTYHREKTHRNPQTGEQSTSVGVIGTPTFGVNKLSRKSSYKPVKEMAAEAAEAFKLAK